MITGNTSEARIDFETRSDVDLKKCGTGPYFESSHFMALGASYRIDDGELKDWEFWQPCPDDLREHIESGGFIRAFNAAFERQCIEQLHKRCGWPLPDISKYRCTAAEAAAMSLPRSLDGVGEALGLPVKKDKDGWRLIRKFSMPRKPRVGEDPNGVYWNEPKDHPEDYQKFIDYRRTDVLTEEAAANRIFPLLPQEQAVYTLNERINSRGIRIDVMSAQSAIRLAEKAKAQLDKEMRAATNGAVNKCSEPAKLVDWVASQGIELTSAAKAEITALLETDDLPSHIRTALEIRQEAAKTSVAKLTSMMARASADGRVRQTSMYHGAGTGRFQSTGVNTSNLPRPRKLYEKAVEDGELRVSTLFEAFRSEDPEYLKFMYGPTLGRPLHLISDALRGFIWAAPDHDLVQADYTSIEGAVVAWLAGEQWKLDAMFEIMADPSLPDLYRRAAAGIMNMTTDVITKKHPLRQSVGKVSELALGYAGGVSAFYSMSQAYGVKLDELYEPVWAAASGEAREKAVKRYEGSLKRGKDRTAELTREAWIACELIKVGWRKTNARIAALWGEVEGAIRDAIQNPGEKFEAGKCTYMVRRGFLWCRMPSGRCLAYGSPKLKDQVWAEVLLDDGEWSDSEVMDREQAEAMERKGKVRIKGKTSPKATALGVNSVTKKWERFALYGGLAVENITQAVARDLLVNGMFKAEEAGYPIIATVYDEIICEVPRGFGDLAEFERVICELPDWAEGLPLSASGWRGKRYRKD